MVFDHSFANHANPCGYPNVATSKAATKTATKHPTNYSMEKG